MNDLQVLECYRTTLLQWHPKLYLSAGVGVSAGGLPSHAQHAYQSDVMKSLKELLRSSDSPKNAMQQHDSICVLAALLVLASHARPMRLTNLPSSILWDRRFFELGLHRWLRCHSQFPNDSAMALFHMGFIALHVNMANIHNMVRLNAVRNASPFTLTAEIRQWQKSDSCEIAILHATRILDMGARTCKTPRRPPNTSQWATRADDLTLLPDAEYNEAPHMAICVYLAAIAKWAATTDGERTSSAQSNLVLECAVDVLQRHALGLAVGLAKILQRLKYNEV